LPQHFALPARHVFRTKNATPHRNNGLCRQLRLQQPSTLKQITSTSINQTQYIQESIQHERSATANSRDISIVANADGKIAQVSMHINDK
jgi:hypothetical protein